MEVGIDRLGNSGVGNKGGAYTTEGCDWGIGCSGGTGCWAGAITSVMGIEDGGAGC